MTANKLYKALMDMGHEAIVAKRACKMFLDFPVEEFLRLDDAAITIAYGKTHPDSQKGAGARTFNAVHTAQRLVAEERLAAEHEAEAKKVAAVEAEKAAEAAAAAEAERRDRENPAFTRAQIKALADYMELCGVDFVDLVTARDFVRAFKIKEA